MSVQTSELGKFTLTRTLPVTINGCLAELERVRAELERMRAREKALFQQMKVLSGFPLSEKLITDQSINLLVGPVSLDQEIKNEGHVDTRDIFTMSSDLNRTLTACSDGIKWGAIKNLATMQGDNRTSPLIDALKKVESGHKDHNEIAKWCSELARMFCLYDEDNNGYLTEDEYVKMINELPISEELKDNLSHQFCIIDIDHSKKITLKEFLFFFLSFPPMKKELGSSFDHNEPYRNLFDLSILQKFRLWIYKVVTAPDFNLLSKILFFVDIALSLIPFGILYLQLISPDINVEKLTVV
jgi:hypothetical protein